MESGDSPLSTPTSRAAPPFGCLQATPIERGTTNLSRRYSDVVCEGSPERPSLEDVGNPDSRIASSAAPDLRLASSKTSGLRDSSLMITGSRNHSPCTPGLRINSPVDPGSRSYLPEARDTVETSENLKDASEKKVLANDIAVFSTSIGETELPCENGITEPEYMSDNQGEGWTTVTHKGRSKSPHLRKQARSAQKLHPEQTQEAKKLLTKDEHEQLEKRRFTLETKPALSYPTKSDATSSCGEGPSTFTKGKGPDPRNWGGIQEMTEVDLEVQWDALEVWGLAHKLSKGLNDEGSDSDITAQCKTLESWNMAHELVNTPLENGRETLHIAPIQQTMKEAAHTALNNLKGVVHSSAGKHIEIIEQRPEASVPKGKAKSSKK
ncbi:hypothetical protein J3A83DRAFT_4458292 [Scleroderma citrinum]